MNKYLNPKKYLNYFNRKTKKICSLLSPKNIKYQIDKVRGWPNRKNFVQCVTFPRSGHHWLVHLLTKYFSKNINYLHSKEDQKNVLRAGTFYYCDFYTHCKQIPCPNYKTNFQKNHDLELKLKKSANFKYIIQFRHCLPSLISWYLFKVRTDNLKDGNQEWEKFARKNIIFWKNFIKKWILSTKNDKNIIYLSYEELTQNPEESLKKVIKFINPKEQINSKFIKDIINKQGIKKVRNIKAFKYFDPKFFKEIEQKIYPELQKLGLKKEI